MDELGPGASDGAIAAYALEREFAVVTNDTDFRRPPLREQCQVLFVDDDTLRAHELADRIDRLSGLVARADLPSVYRLAESNLL